MKNSTAINKTAAITDANVGTELSKVGVTVITMSAAVIIGYFYKKWKYFVFAIPIIVGFSRVYVGVHYPFDVLGGWLFGYGLAWGMLSIWVILKVREIKRGRTWINYL